MGLLFLGLLGMLMAWLLLLILRLGTSAGLDLIYPLRFLVSALRRFLVNKGFVEEVLGRYGLLCGGYVLSIGRLAWCKGYDLLINAWKFVKKEYPWLKLVIAGSDWGYKRELLARIRRYDLKNVVLLENVPSEGLHALYNGSLFAGNSLGLRPSMGLL